MKIKNLSYSPYHLIVLSTLILALQSYAQRASGPTAAQGRLMNNFNQTAPAIGERLPLLKGFDSDGHPWNTGLLKAQYSVLVFGCLT